MKPEDYDSPKNERENGFESEGEPTLGNLLREVDWLTDEWLRNASRIDSRILQNGKGAASYLTPEQMQQLYEGLILSLKNKYQEVLAQTGLEIQLVKPSRAISTAYAVGVTIADQDQFLAYLQQVPPAGSGSIHSLLSEFSHRIFRNDKYWDEQKIGLDAQEAEILLTLTSLRDKLRAEMARLDAGSKLPLFTHSFDTLFQLLDAVEKGYGKEFLSVWRLIEKYDDIYGWAQGMRSIEEYRKRWSEVVTRIASFAENPKAVAFQQHVIQILAEKIHRISEQLLQHPHEHTTDVLKALEEAKTSLLSIGTMPPVHNTPLTQPENGSY